METSIKDSFLEDNRDYKEIKPSKEVTTIGGFQEIDEVEDEVWLLQCPKGFDIKSELEDQRLKIPGRTNFNSSEAVAVEYDLPELRAFGYCNRKGRYSLRLLPVKGNILLRGRLKATEAVTLENAEALYPPQGRVPLPDMIKVRHPLHGHQFDKSLRVDRAIAERLKKADEISAKVLYEAIMNRKNAKSRNLGLSKQKQKTNTVTAVQKSNVVCIDSTDDDEAEFDRESKEKKSERKRKPSDGSLIHQESEIQSTNEESVKKRKKHSKSDLGEEISKDLQWLQNL
ncbi:uncharacterized protein LOC128859673 [Anastrepha ludens]|uniref:uncharacterized protein LOC128859673 n=1 Tax=Anastrepha ludens TaxID=28586 RepID=UPI0023AF9DD5|nr:uncharacterized protein LOC128859673 [Anastrepha ludens]